MRRCVTVAVGLLVSAPAAALTLDEAREIATAQAIAVEQARARRDAAADRAWVATAENLPAIVGFTSVNTGAGFTPFGFPRPVQTQLGAGVRGTWALISPGDWGAARAARQTAAGQEALVAWSLVEARRGATTAFSAAVAAEEAEAAWARAEEDAARAAEAVRALAEAGIRPAADAARARAEAAAVAAERATSAWTAQARCAELLALLRQDARGDCALEPGEVPAPADGPAAHPALESARAAELTARGALLAVTGALAPRLDGSGTAAWYATNEGPVGVGWSAGLDLTVPLMASGAGAKGRSAQQAEVAVAQLALEDQERALRVALRSAEARLTAARASRAAREESLAAAESALTLVQERYDQGLASLTDWMDARRVRDAAAVALAQARGELGAATAEVEAARGVGR